MPSERPVTEHVQKTEQMLTLRVPISLYAEIADRSELEGRSMNKIGFQALTEYLSKPQEVSP